MTDNRIRNIPLDKIKPNPLQPRRYFDKDAMLSLTTSIERYGVISPITVRDMGDDTYEVISGERRYRAAFYAGLADIPCIITDTDINECAILSLLENLQREDLSFLEIAESYRELVKKQGVSSCEISRKLGEKPFEIHEKISLTRLDPIVRKYIRNYRLTERQAYALLKIHDRKRQIDTVRQICENHLNERETLQFISDLVGNNEQPNIHINKIKNIKVLRNTLTKTVNLIRSSGTDVTLDESASDFEKRFIITIRTD